MVAADQCRVVLFNSKTGAHVNTIKLPPNYDTLKKSKKSDNRDMFSWNGHTDFAFAEDGIIVIHNQRNFPIGADILLFW